MSNTYFPSQTKSAASNAETHALKILKQHLWHFTSVGMGNCRAAQRVRREIECHVAPNPPTHQLSNSQTVSQTLERLTSGLAHLESIGLANSRAAQIASRELSRQLLIQSALLANANFDQNEPRDRRGRWIKEGDAGDSATNNPTQTVPPTPEEIRRAAQTMPWEQFHGTEADYIASHPNDPVYSALRAANNPVPGPPSIRAFTPWEKFTFDLRQLMFKLLPGTRPDGYGSPLKVLGAISMLLPFGIGPETKLGKLLLAYFAVKTAAAQRAYYGAIKQELQTGNYSDASRHAVEDLLNIAVVGAGIDGAMGGEGPKGPEPGKVPEEPAEVKGAPEETKTAPANTDKPENITQHAPPKPTNYRRVFFASHPELKGKVVVHHAVEQKVLKLYPGVMTESEIHNLANLRGIPKGVNAQVHLRRIRKEWNVFYREHPTSVTKEQLIDKARELDRRFGRDFNPPISGENQ